MAGKEPEIIETRDVSVGDIAFDYYRYFGGRMISKTSIVRVTVNPKLVNQ